jgi:TonB family protein
MIGTLEERRVWGRRLAFALCLALAQTAAAASLRYPQELAPAADGSAADVRVQMTLADDGEVLKSRVIESTRPEINGAVVEALSAWRFRPRKKDDKPVKWSGEMRFSFAQAQAVDMPPVVKHRSLGSISRARLGELGPLEEGSAWFIEEEGEEPIPPLPNELWVSYPKDAQWSGKDPEASLEAVVDPDGSIAAARVLNAVTPKLAEAAVSGALTADERFAAATRAGNNVTAAVEIPVRFYAWWKPTKQTQEPDHPQNLLGNDGRVLLDLTVEKDGTVRDPRVRGASHPDFERALLSALQKWQFTPAQRFGKPVAIRSGFKYTFRAGRSGPAGREAYKIGDGGPVPEAQFPTVRYDTSPKVTMATDTAYPFELLREGIEGKASVDVSINPEGNVQEVRVLEASRPEFGLALKAAMEGWRFEPARKDGQPSWAVFRYERKFRPEVSENGLSDSALHLLRELKSDHPAIVAVGALDAHPVATFQVQPVYPRKALDAGTRDRVTVEYFVDRDGSVQLPHAIAFQDESLAWAAVTAVPRWRYEPPRSGGKPVDARLRCVLVFEPQEAEPAPQAPSVKAQ